MSLSRREFVRTLGIGGAGTLSMAAIIGRGREALAWGPDPLDSMAQAADQQIVISSNENPRGPGQAALDAISGRTNHRVGRYGRDVARTELPEAIARVLGKGTKSENILLSTGSGGILTAAVRAYCSPSKRLVNGAPSYGSPTAAAQEIGADARLVPVDDDLRLDLDAMAEAANGAGLVFLCNPNNPTSTLHGLTAVTAFVDRVKSSSPDTAILIDEAYIDYATDPTVGTAIGPALEHSDVFIARTFSKAYGMAGLRLGYAAGQTETLAKLQSAWGLGDVSLLTAAAAVGSLNDPAHMREEREENGRIRDYTISAFKEMGYEAAGSQTNFLFVNIGRPARDFREACAARGVRVGRDFPPMEKTHARISIGTMEEMQRAVEVFREVLGAATMSSAAR